MVDEPTGKMKETNGRELTVMVAPTGDKPEQPLAEV